VTTLKLKLTPAPKAQTTKVISNLLTIGKKTGPATVTTVPTAATTAATVAEAQAANAPKPKVLGMLSVHPSTQAAASAPASSGGGGSGGGGDVSDSGEPADPDAEPEFDTSGDDVTPAPAASGFAMTPGLWIGAGLAAAAVVALLATSGKSY
jgi:hypothetical protein